MRSHPRNLVSLNKAPANLIDAFYDTVGHVVLHYQVLIDRLGSPGLARRHRRDRHFAQLARLSQAAVPLADRPLPFTDRQRLSGNVCSNVATDSSRDNVHAIKLPGRQWQRLTGWHQHIHRTLAACAESEWNTV